MKYIDSLYKVIDQIVVIYRKNFTTAWALSFIILVLLAWSNRFVQDDAFISFRYAEHFADGKGFVWNDGGEHIEGFTNFLWTLIMAGGIKLGYDPIQFSLTLGLIFFGLTLVVIYILAKNIFNSRDFGLLIMLLAGSNYSFSAYATGGLATMMQTFIFTSAVYFSIKICDRPSGKKGTLFIISLLLSFALLIRLDSAMLIMVIFAFLLYCCFTSNCMMKERIFSFSFFVVPMFFIIGGWLAWKYWYFGNILPNTFYVKAASGVFIKYGIKYIYIFLTSTFLIMFPVFFITGFPKLIPLLHRKWIFLMAVITVWMMYILKIGGDFMEFRFIVPIIPVAMIINVWLIQTIALQKSIKVALIFLIFLGSLHHALTFGGITFVTEVASITELKDQREREMDNWDGIGMVLGEELNYSQDVTIAVTAAGMIPYYSKLKTIDMLGLNDKWVAKNGIPYRDKPGHRKIATFDYLLKQNVNLLIGHPQMREIRVRKRDVYFFFDLEMFRISIKSPEIVPDEAEILEIPIGDRYKLLTLYLKKNSLIENAIKNHNWRRVPIDLVNLRGFTLD